MTINGISAGATYTQSFSTSEARIAALVLNNEDQQQSIDQESLSVARERYIEASKEEVEAIRSEASHIFQGAMIQAGVIVAGSTLQVVAVRAEGAAGLRATTADCALDKAKALVDAKTWGVVGSIGASASSGLAPALNGALGEARATYDRADAKEAANEAKLAEWAMDDRRNAISASRSDQDQAVQWLSKLVDGQAATNTAVLADMA